MDELRELARFYRNLAQMHQQAALDCNCKSEELLSLARRLTSHPTDRRGGQTVDNEKRTAASAGKK